MPNFSNDEGRYFYQPKGKSWLDSVEIPHIPTLRPKGCTCLCCLEEMSPDERYEAEQNEEALEEMKKILLDPRKKEIASLLRDLMAEDALEEAGQLRAFLDAKRPERDESLPVHNSTYTLGHYVEQWDAKGKKWVSDGKNLTLSAAASRVRYLARRKLHSRVVAHSIILSTQPHIPVT